MKNRLGKVVAPLLLLVAVPVASVEAKGASKSESAAAVYARNDSYNCSPLQQNTISNDNGFFYAVVKYPAGVDPINDLDYYLKDKNGKVFDLTDTDPYSGGCQYPYKMVLLSETWSYSFAGALGSHTLVVNYSSTGKTFANNSFRFYAP